jgi:hypothetical protein
VLFRSGQRNADFFLRETVPRRSGDYWGTFFGNEPPIVIDSHEFLPTPLSQLNELLIVCSQA